MRTRSQSRKETSRAETIIKMEGLEALLRDAHQPKLPTFDAKKLDLWFIRVETEFAASGITEDDVKYYSVLRALDGPTTEEITDILGSPPDQDKYVNLKNTLVERFGVSQKDKLRQVLKGIPLGEKRPSQLLREMKSKAANALTEEALHGLWVEKLPRGLKAFLAMSDDLGLDQLAKMADRIYPEIPQDNAAMAVTTNPRSDTSAPLVSALLTRINNLEKTVAEILTEFKELKLKESKPKYKSHSRSRSRSRQPSTDGLCRYHRKFGDDARFCKLPCTFRSQEQENIDRCRR